MKNKCLGAGSGIGRAVCKVFASEGATIIGADMNKKGVEETMTMIQGSGIFTFIYQYFSACKTSKLGHVS